MSITMKIGSSYEENQKKSEKIIAKLKTSVQFISVVLFKPDKRLFVKCYA